MSHKSERKARQREQKLQLQEHQPQQRVNRRHQEPRDQPERHNRRDAQPPPTVPKTPETFDRGTQIDVVIQPMLVRKEPRREHNTPPPPAIIPPQAPLRRRIFMVLFGAAFFVGLAIGQAFRWLAPKAAEPIYLGIEVFVVSMLNFVIILAVFLLRLVSGNWGQLDYGVMTFMTAEVLFLMLTTVLIAGYITRQVQSNDAAFSTPAQVGPYQDGDTSEESDEGGYVMWSSSSEDEVEVDFAGAA